MRICTCHTWCARFLSAGLHALHVLGGSLPQHTWFQLMDYLISFSSRSEQVCLWPIWCMKAAKNMQGTRLVEVPAPVTCWVRGYIFFDDGECGLRELCNMSLASPTMIESVEPPLRWLVTALASPTQAVGDNKAISVESFNCSCFTKEYRISFFVLNLEWGGVFILDLSLVPSASILSSF